VSLKVLSRKREKKENCIAEKCEEGERKEDA
jgi:hypothetical protein